jgi:O-antigen ligase
VSATAAAAPAARDRLALWCGWVMVGAAPLVPLLGWLAPLGFAPLLALMGLLCLPALRIADEDRPVLIVLTGALIWAAVSTLWSPWHAKGFQRNGALQLALALPLYWSAICGARRAEPRLSALALDILGWGAFLFGVAMLAEAATGARLYQHLRESAIGPIRIDLAQANVGHGAYVLALLWPAVLVGRFRRRWEAARLGVTLMGMALAAHLFSADAPLIAIPLSALAMAVVWRWPAGGPRLAAFKVALLSLAMPGVVWAVRAYANYRALEADVPLSWSVRLSYWSHTIDWIFQKPVQGWGLDASRAIGPEIQLHPHNGALQIWLELGLIGAVAAAVFWGLSLIRLSRPKPDLAIAGVAGSVVAYILFAWVNYGAWQQWWVAVGALIPVMAALLTNTAVKAKST